MASPAYDQAPIIPIVYSILSEAGQPTSFDRREDGIRTYDTWSHNPAF